MVEVRLVILLVLTFSCLFVLKFGWAARENCETCHTDKAALKDSLSPLSPRPAEEEES
jgi:hypothetical protein